MRTALSLRCFLPLIVDFFRAAVRAVRAITTDKTPIPFRSPFPSLLLFPHGKHGASFVHPFFLLSLFSNLQSGEFYYGRLNFLVWCFPFSPFFAPTPAPEWYSYQVPSFFSPHILAPFFGLDHGNDNVEFPAVFPFRRNKISSKYFFSSSPLPISGPFFGES